MSNWENALSDLENIKTQTVQLGFDVSAQLDKELVSLSGAALVFSMAFVDKLAPQKLLLPVLMGAWVFFGLSLAAVLTGLREAQRALSKQVEDLGNLQKLISSPEGRAAADNMAAKEGAGAPITESGSAQFTIVAKLNLAAFALFMLGIVSLGIFVGYNLWHAVPAARR
jgi:hypothetical protein